MLAGGLCGRNLRNLQKMVDSLIVGLRNRLLILSIVWISSMCFGETPSLSPTPRPTTVAEHGYDQPDKSPIQHQV
jgi:hypothetical protein